MDFDPPIALLDRKTAPNQEYYFRWVEGGDIGLPDAWLVIQDETGKPMNLTFRNVLAVEHTTADLLSSTEEWKSQKLEPYVLYELDFIEADEILDKMDLMVPDMDSNFTYKIIDLTQYVLWQDDTVIQIYAEAMEVGAHEDIFDARDHLARK